MFMKELKINNRTIRQIIDNISFDFARFTTRDLTFLAASIFTQSHLNGMKFLSGVDFKFIFWYAPEKNKVVFYKPEKEYFAFAQAMHKKCNSSIKYTDNLTAKLVKLSDEIIDFLEYNTTKDKLLENWDNFFALYRDWFAYHQAVFYASEYLSKNKSTSKISSKDEIILKKLGKTYKYNENIIPTVEKYLIKLGVSGQHWKEVGSSNYSRAVRSLLLLNKQEYILNRKDADTINKKIEAEYKNFLKIKEPANFIVAYKGKVKGIAQVIKNVYDLKKFKKGNILVTTGVRPQFNDKLMHAKAIITDEGGLLSHGAMLAREFKIPCIVGMGDATKKFKDGDFVEVDADKGIVKTLKRAKK